MRCSRAATRFRLRVLLWWQAYRLPFVSDYLSLATYRSNVGEIAGEPPWLRGPTGRPLEPDAGNAAEGSEGPMPDWRFQPSDFPAHGFFNHEWSERDERHGR